MLHANPEIDWTSINAVQEEIHRWASQQFPHRTSFEALTKLVMHEVPELLIHEKEKGIDTIGTELADCFILLMDLASIWNVNLPRAIRAKMEINYNRTWRIGAGGLMQHVPVKDDSAATLSCPRCGSPRVRPIEGDDPIAPHLKLGEVTRHTHFCKSCQCGFEAGVIT